MNRPAWMEELAFLAARYCSVVGADLAALTLAELWGVYLFLRTWAERGG